MQMKRNIKDDIKTALCIVSGNLLLAFLVAAFVLPHGIIMGGTTGIAIVMQRFFGTDISLIVFLLNALLLLSGLLFIGKKLFFTSIASTVLYPAFLALFERIPGIGSLTDNTLLAALFAGVLMGLALGLVMRVGSSTGGMDIANLILSKWMHKPVAVFVYLTDIAVVGAQALTTDMEAVLIGTVVLALESLVLERVMVFGQAQIELFVVSNAYQTIKNRFLNELQAGVTLSHIQTGVWETEQKAVMCIIPPAKLYRANEIVAETDPDAFMTITKIKEVHGRGFTTARTVTTMKK